MAETFSRNEPGASNELDGHLVKEVETAQQILSVQQGSCHVAIIQKYTMHNSSFGTSGQKYSQSYQHSTVVPSLNSCKGTPQWGSLLDPRLTVLCKMRCKRAVSACAHTPLVPPLPKVPRKKNFYQLIHEYCCRLSDIGIN